MEQEPKSRLLDRLRTDYWRHGIVGVAGGMLGLLAAAYHIDLLEREPYPVMRSELQVEDVDSSFVGRSRFRWLNNDRIVALVGERPDPRPRDRKRMIHSMKVWDTRTNDVRTLVADDVDDLCLADGYFRIMVRKSGPDGKEVLEFYAGREGTLQRVPPGRFDDVSCRQFDEVPLPEWTKTIRDPDVNIKRLRPEDGFLTIQRDSRDLPAKKIFLHKPDGTSSDVSSILGDPPVMYPFVEPLYFEFKNAYLLDLVSKGLPASWLYRDGRVVQAWALSPKSFEVDRSLSGDRPITDSRSSSIRRENFRAWSYREARTPRTH